MGAHAYPSAQTAFDALKSSWCHQRCETLRLNETPWRPYVDHESCADVREGLAFGVRLDSRREIYLVESGGPIGQGGNALVFAVVVRAYWAEAPAGAKCYMPAALKVHRTAHEMTREAHAACCVNDLRRAGLSPNLSCILDAFALVKTYDHASGPPKGWKASFQDHINDRYATRQADATRDHWSENAIIDNGGEMQLSPMVPIMVTLSELVAPPSCDRHASNGSKVLLVDDRNHRPPLVDLPRACTASGAHMASVIFQTAHAVHSMHTFNMLHGDVQPGNVLVAASPDGVFLDPAGGCGGALDSDHGTPEKASVARRHTEGMLGKPPGCEAKGRAYAWCLDRSDPGDRFASVARLPPDAPAVLCIDFGTTAECEVWRGADPDSVRTSHFANCLPEYVRRECRYFVSRSDSMLYDDVGVDRHHLGCVDSERTALLPHHTPGMRLLEKPVTQVYCRPPECIAVGVPDSESVGHSHATGGVAVYSDCSDVYSTAVVLASFLLGFDVFSGLVDRGASPDVHRCGWEVREHHFRHREDSGASSSSSSPRPPDRGGRASMWYVQDSAVRSVREHMQSMHQSRDVHMSNCARRWLEPCEQAYLARTWVARCTAIGEPGAGVLRGTIMETCRPVGQPHQSPWLGSALLRRLTSRYGASFRDAQDLVDRLVACLHWDPAKRPTTRQLLRCSWFFTLFKCTATPPHEIVAKEAWWAASRPHAASWSYKMVRTERDAVPRAQFDKPSVVTKHLLKLGKDIVKCSGNNAADRLRRQLYRKAACRPVVRLGRRRKWHYKRTPLHASRMHLHHHGALFLSRWLSRAIFRNVVYGAGLDPVHLHPVYTIYPSAELSFVLNRRIAPGVFASRESLRKFVNITKGPQSRREMPTWARVRLDVSEDAPQDDDEAATII